MEPNVQSVYNTWAETYDEQENKTRDLDKKATQNILSPLINSSSMVLEFGCGTGKNTEWLANVAGQITAVDFSEEMLNRAKQKLLLPNLIFKQADITKSWPFANESFNLITCNLILEHVENLDFVFFEAQRILRASGYFFVSELHPVKQYTGSKARFELNNKSVSPDCYTHHVSDYFSSALKSGFTCTELKEWFDDHNRDSVPRLINFLFQKQKDK